MHEHVTLLPPEARPDERGLSSSLRADLLPYFLAWFVATVAGVPLTAGSFARTGFLALNAGAVVAYGPKTGLASGGPSISRPGPELE